MRNPRHSLSWKAALAIMAAVGFCNLALLALLSAGGGDVQGGGMARLVQLANWSKRSKARALMDNDYERMKDQLERLRQGRLERSFALIDTAGEERLKVGNPPDMSQPPASDLLKRAAGGETVSEVLDNTGVVIVPLGSGSSGGFPGANDEILVGMFLAAETGIGQSAGSEGAADAAYWVRAVFGSAALAGLLFGIIYWLFLRPIHLLGRSGAEVDAEAGYFPPAPVERFSSDELGGLALQRNRLIERLAQEQELARQANGLLERTEAKYRGLVENSRDIVWRSDLTGQFLFASPSIESELGRPPQDFYDSPEQFFECVDREDRERVRMAFEAMIQGESINGIEFRLVGLNDAGEGPRWYSMTHSPILDGRGQVQGIEGVLRNITQTKVLEGRLDVARQQLEALYDLAEAGRQNMTRRQLFDKFAAHSAELLGMEGAIVARILDESYRVVGLSNFPEEIARGSHSLANAPLGKIVRTCRPLLLMSEEAWMVYGLEAAFVGVPVLDRKGDAVGAIGCYGAPAPVSDEAVRTLFLVAELLAPMLITDL